MLSRGVPTRKKISISVSIELLERFDELCSQTGKTRSRLFEDAISNLIAANNRREGIPMEEQEKRTKVMCIANSKGGVGKTTTAAALAYLFARDGKEVLLIDADYQSNLTVNMRAPLNDQNIMNCILNETDDMGYTPDQFIVPTQYKHIDIIAGHEGIVSETFQNKVRQMRIAYGTNPWKNIVDYIRNLHKYDIIIIDTHPSKDALEAMLPLQTADEVLSPAETDTNSLQGVLQIYGMIRNSRNIAPQLHFMGMFFNRVKPSTKNAHEFIPSARKSVPEAIRDANGGQDEGIVFNTLIRDSVDVSTSVNFQSAVTDRFSNKKISDDFRSLYREVVKCLG